MKNEKKQRENKYQTKFVVNTSKQSLESATFGDVVF